MPGRDALAAIIEQVGDSYLQRRLLRQAERATPGFLAGFKKSAHDIICVLGDLGEEDLVELVRRGGAPTVRDLAAVVAEYPTLSRRVAAAVPDGRWKVLEADPEIRPEPARARLLDQIRDLSVEGHLAYEYREFAGPGTCCHRRRPWRGRLLLPRRFVPRDGVVEYCAVVPSGRCATLEVYGGGQVCGRRVFPEGGVCRHGTLEVAEILARLEHPGSRTVLTLVLREGDGDLVDAQPVFAADPLPGEAEEVDFDGANGRNVLLVLPERVQEAGPTPTCPDPHLALALRVLYNLRPYTGRVRVGLYCVACRACVEDVPAEATDGHLETEVPHLDHAGDLLLKVALPTGRKSASFALHRTGDPDRATGEEPEDTTVQVPDTVPWGGELPVEVHAARPLTLACQLRPAEAPAGLLDGLGPAQVPVSSLRSHGSLVRSGGIPAAGDTPPWTDPRGNAGLAGVHFGWEVEAFQLHHIEQPAMTIRLPIHTRYRPGGYVLAVFLFDATGVRRLRRNVKIVDAGRIHLHAPRVLLAGDRAMARVIAPAGSGDTCRLRVNGDDRTVALADYGGYRVGELEVVGGDRIAGPSDGAADAPPWEILCPQRYAPEVAVWEFLEPGRTIHGNTPRTLFSHPRYFLLRVCERLLAYPHWCGEQTSSKLHALWHLARHWSLLSQETRVRLDFVRAQALEHLQEHYDDGLFAIFGRPAGDARRDLPATRKVLLNLAPYRDDDGPVGAMVRRGIERLLQAGVRDTALAELDRRLCADPPKVWNLAEAYALYFAGSDSHTRDAALDFLSRWGTPTPFSVVPGELWGGGVESRLMVAAMLQAEGLDVMSGKVEPSAAPPPGWLRAFLERHGFLNPPRVQAPAVCEVREPARLAVSRLSRVLYGGTYGTSATLPFLRWIGSLDSPDTDLEAKVRVDGGVQRFRGELRIQGTVEAVDRELFTTSPAPAGSARTVSNGTDPAGEGGHRPAAPTSRPAFRTALSRDRLRVGQRLHLDVHVSRGGRLPVLEMTHSDHLQSVSLGERSMESLGTGAHGAYLEGGRGRVTFLARFRGTCTLQIAVHDMYGSPLDAVTERLMVTVE